MYNGIKFKVYGSGTLFITRKEDISNNIITVFWRDYQDKEYSVEYSLSEFVQYLDSGEW